MSAIAAKLNHVAAYPRWVAGVIGLADCASGGLLGCSPGGALAATSRMAVLRSGTIIPLTSPPGQFTLALGFFDQPTSTLMPGPSAPVAQSRICTYPGSPSRFSPA